MRKTPHEQDIQDAIEWAQTRDPEGSASSHILQGCQRHDFLNGVLAAAHEYVSQPSTAGSSTLSAARRVVEIARKNHLQTDDDVREYMRIRAAGKLFRARLVRYDKRQKYRQAGVLK